MPILPGAQNFVVNVQGDLVDNSPTQKIGSGLKLLLDGSYPEAFYDSSSHPLSCFPGTRLQYIEDITGWAWALATERHFRMMWMQGPAGVGKSTLAQSCAEKAGARLAAAFFFSRSNSRDISTHLFPSIAYQLTTKYPAYRDKLDKKIIYDPSIVNKSIAVQFRELIVVPFQELEKEGQSVKEGVIFIDGLDECAGDDEQCSIIDTISTSVHEHTTPFLWAFFSRPEPHIVAQFSTPNVANLCWQPVLHVSRDADEDIKLYLQDGFRRIRAKYGIPSAVLWPSKHDIRELVRRSAGLFVYPASVIRFVGEGGPLGPEEQLRLTLQLPSKLLGNPWLHLDAFYTLIMKQIPKDILPIVLKLLLLIQPLSYLTRTYMFADDVLGLSFSTYCAALSKLHSVVKLTYTNTGLPKAIGFHHASFMDFLGDPERSREFCVKTPEVCAMLLADIIRRFNSKFDNKLISHGAFYVFWEFGSHARLDEGLLRQLAQCNFRNMPRDCAIKRAGVDKLFDNIPPAWQKNIMWLYYPSPWTYLFRRNDPTEATYVLGQGNKACGLAPSGNGRNYQLCNLRMVALLFTIRVIYEILNLAMLLFYPISLLLSVVMVKQILIAVPSCLLIVYFVLLVTHVGLSGGN